MKKLCIGISVYDDYDGIYFTIQSLRLHQKLPYDTEFIIIDNNPNSNQGKETKKFIENDIKGKYIPYVDSISSFSKYKAIEYATARYFLGLDSHVLLVPGAVTNFLHLMETKNHSKDLIQGPLLYDDQINVSTHFNPEWSGGMYGKWGTDSRHLLGDPFEIPMNGMGLYGFETTNWPSINQNFKGFGGEEWYIHEKFRQNGGKTLCLPSLKWLHRFNRPNGVPYPNIWEDRIWNYHLGWWELYHDVNHPLIRSIDEHFNQYVSPKVIDQIFENVINL